MDLLITALLFIAALLILLWWKDLNKPSLKLIKRIGVGIGVMSLRGFIDLSYYLVTLSEKSFIYSLIPEILGLLLIMFGFFNFLEARKT